MIRTMEQDLPLGSQIAPAGGSIDKLTIPPTAQKSVSGGTGGRKEVLTPRLAEDILYTFGSSTASSTTRGRSQPLPQKRGNSNQNNSTITTPIQNAWSFQQVDEQIQYSGMNASAQQGFALPLDGAQPAGASGASATKDSLNCNLNNLLNSLGTSAHRHSSQRQQQQQQQQQLRQLSASNPTEDWQGLTDMFPGGVECNFDAAVTAGQFSVAPNGQQLAGQKRTSEDILAFPQSHGHMMMTPQTRSQHGEAMNGSYQSIPPSQPNPQYQRAHSHPSMVLNQMLRRTNTAPARKAKRRRRSALQVERQRERNRESSRRLRQRQKVYREGLRARVAAMQAEVIQLQTERDEAAECSEMLAKAGEWYRNEFISLDAEAPRQTVILQGAAMNEEGEEDGEEQERTTDGIEKGKKKKKESIATIIRKYNDRALKLLTEYQQDFGLSEAPRRNHLSKCFDGLRKALLPSPQERLSILATAIQSEGPAVHQKKGSLSPSLDDAASREFLAEAESAGLDADTSRAIAAALVSPSQDDEDEVDGGREDMKKEGEKSRANGKTPGKEDLQKCFPNVIAWSLERLEQLLLDATQLMGDTVNDVRHILTPAQLVRMFGHVSANTHSSVMIDCGYESLIRGWVAKKRAAEPEKTPFALREAEAAACAAEIPVMSLLKKEEETEASDDLTFFEKALSTSSAIASR